VSRVTCGPALWTFQLSRGLFTLESVVLRSQASGLVLCHGMPHKDLDLRDYLDAGYRSKPNMLPQIGPRGQLGDSLLDLANRRYTSVVDLKTILSLKDRAQTLGSQVSASFAWDLRPNDFKISDVILLGASGADLGVELYEPMLNFLLRSDYKGVYRRECGAERNHCMALKQLALLTAVRPGI